MLKNCLIFCSLLICFGQIYCVVDPKVVCYYDNWLVWRTDESKITVTDVDSSLCTHIVYSYLGVTSASQIYIDDRDLLIEKHDLVNFTKNKGKAKALLALGGWGYSLNPDKKAYWVSNILNNPSNFVTDVVSFCKSYGFDGITIDWSRDTWSEEDMTKFVSLLKDLRTAFGSQYTLVVSLGAETVRYDIKGVVAQVDFINVQTIDYHGNWDDTTGYGAPIDLILRTLDKWYSEGADTAKLLMTVPFYAHTWTLKDPAKKDVGSAVSGPGRQGKWSQAAGKLGYNEICHSMTTGVSWETHRDKGNESIYGVYDKDQWVTFEDPESLEEKTRTVTGKGYGGVAVQALENDDFRNLCQKGAWALLKGVNKGLNRDPVTHAPPTQTPSPTSDPTQICKGEGVFPDPHDCHVYHNCIEYFPGVYTDEKQTCPQGEGFDDKTKKCVEHTLIPGCN